ncbi:hypothetical protein AAF712_006967 [Marasmius tenuissimus]|uniref:CCHC-type domain-containing protein n=1 Tax=Marasmius tenuissimus TaxID=585030 RepID=A0ABR2ZX47_9AGAR
MPSPTVRNEQADQPEVGPAGGTNTNQQDVSIQEEVRFWAGEASLSPRNENQTPWNSPNLRGSTVNPERGSVGRESRSESQHSEGQRGRQPRAHGSVVERTRTLELPRTLDEDARNVGLQQQLLNSILEVNSEVLEKIKEEARDRTYSEFLEWRERDRRERLEEIENREKAARREKTSGEQEPARQESVAVSNNIVQRIGRMAGEGTRPAGSTSKFESKRPVDYLAPNSHLGKLLIGLGDNPPSDDGSDTSDDEDRKPKKEESVKGKETEKPTAYAEEMKLKPIRPNKYDGAMNPRKFLRFSKEAYRLVKDGKVPKHRQVDIVSHYLEGKAYSFYERTCGDCPDEWVLKDFLIQLYNYVFPLSFRTEQRRKLKTLTQHGRRIREYVGEFEDLCDIIGMTDEREMVTLLWDGFDSSISAGLYNRDLHPERSSLKDVVAAAEMVELVEGVRKNTSFGRDSGRRKDRSKSRDPDRDNKRSGPKFTAKNDSQKSQDKGNNRSNKTYQSKDKKDKLKGRKQLSEAEKKEYTAAGKCFGCGEVGHFSRNCPTNNSVKSDSRKAKNPPGVSAHNLEFALADDLRESFEESVMTVNAINWYEDVEMTYYSDSGSESSGEPTKDTNITTPCDEMSRETMNMEEDRWGNESVVESPPGTPHSRHSSNESMALETNLARVSEELEEWVNEGGWGDNYGCVQDRKPMAHPHSEPWWQDVFLKPNGDLLDNHEEITSDDEDEYYTPNGRYNCREVDVLLTDGRVWYQEERRKGEFEEIARIRRAKFHSNLFRLRKEKVSRKNRSGTYLYRHLNHISFGWEDDPAVPRAFGDPVANRAEFILSTCGPYLPGEAYNEDELGRFMVYRVSKDTHVLIDNLYDSLYPGDETAGAVGRSNGMAE